MNDFNSMFPNFLTLCLSLKTLLTPVAFLLITGGLIATTIANHRSDGAALAIGKVIIFVMLLVYLPTWGNQVVTVVDDLVKNTLKVDPAQIHDQYQAALQMKKSDDGNKSWWENVIHFQVSMFEGLMSGVFLIMGWLASTIEWWAYIFQTAILFVGYALSPIFIGMLAFPSVNQTGRNYLINLLGVMIWPLGWGVAGIITQGMIAFMTDQSFLSSPIVGSVQYSLQNLMGLAFLGVWIIFSTIAAPIAIQRAIFNGSSAVSSLLSGGFSAGRAAATAGATTFAGSATNGIKGAIAIAAAGEALVGSSMDQNGSLIGSLAQMNSRSSGQKPSSEKKNPPTSFPTNDPTGDKTVGELLQKSQESVS